MRASSNSRPFCCLAKAAASYLFCLLNLDEVYGSLFALIISTVVNPRDVFFICFFWIARSLLVLVLFFVGMYVFFLCSPLLFAVSGSVCCALLCYNAASDCSTPHPFCYFGIITGSISGFGIWHLASMPPKPFWNWVGLIKWSLPNDWASSVELVLSKLGFMLQGYDYSLMFLCQICSSVLSKWLLPDMLDHSWHLSTCTYLFFSSVPSVVYYSFASY